MSWRYGRGEIKWRLSVRDLGVPEVKRETVRFRDDLR